MFQDVLINEQRPIGARAWVMPLSFMIHAGLVMLIICLPLLHVGNLPRYQVAADAFLIIPPHPAPPPPPPKKSAGAHAGRIKPVQARLALEAGKLIAPVEIPCEIAEEQIFGTGVDGGIDGGVEGGIPGGSFNGIIGPILDLLGGPAELPVRVAGEVRQPRLLRRIEPVYPEIARQARVEGVVIIEATTDIYGRVANDRVLRSIPLLDEAALEAVRKWMYEPMVINGRPRGVVFTVTVRFVLR
jgi:protein TonB